MIKKSIISIFIASSFAGTLIANEAPALPVQTFKVEKKEVNISRTYPTILKSAEQVDVLARVSGTLQEKYFNEGEYVQKGTLLYKIEQDSYLANLNIKKAEFTKAKKDYERAKSLIASKSITPQAFDEYTYYYESSKAALDEAQIQYNYTKVTAPISGVTGIKKQDIGDLVGTSSTNSTLVTITSINPIHAEFSLPKDDINKYLEQIKSNLVKVNLITNNKSFEGVIDFVSPTIDVNTDTLLVRAKFDNKDSSLIVGNFAQIEISNISLKDVFIVPENAVLKTSKASLVMVVDENNIAQPKPIVAGELIKDGVVVQGGLNGNEQVIISNIAKLRQNTKVQIVNKEK